MSSELKVPALPESVADALVAAWHKKPGETFQEGDLLVDLETDKIMLEVPAPFNGKLIAISADVNSQVKSSEVLATLEEVALVETKNDETVVSEKEEKKDTPISEPSAHKEIEEPHITKVK